MFRNGTLKELSWVDNGAIKGTIRVNKKIDYKNIKRPLKRNSVRELISIGRVNYALLDDFVMKSMNHFYSTIQTGKDKQEVNKKIMEYNELYQLWYKVNVARQNNDMLINTYYDDIVYRLYLLGYKN